MTRFTVELVGVPVAGRRNLNTPRDHPPTQIPVVIGRGSSRAGERSDHDDEPSEGGPDVRTVAVYRYSRFERAHQRHVYTYQFERGLSVRR